MTHQPGVYVPLRALFLVIICIKLKCLQKMLKEELGLEAQPPTSS